MGVPLNHNCVCWIFHYIKTFINHPAIGVAPFFPYPDVMLVQLRLGSSFFSRQRPGNVPPTRDTHVGKTWENHQK